MKEKIKKNLLSILTITVLVLVGITFGLEVAQAGEITSISPDVLVPYETVVTIYGSGFGDSQGKWSMVYFNDLYLNLSHSYLYWSDTEIRVKPASFDLLVGHKVMVKVCSDTCWYCCTEIDGPNYYLKPRIDALSSNFGNIGQEISISGSYFGDSPGSISLNGVDVLINEWSSRKIKFNVLSNVSNGNLVVTTNNGHSTDGKHFEVLQPCSSDTWLCGDWSICSVYGLQNRTCSKTFDCQTANTPSPSTSQSCTPPPPSCNADTWSCGEWNICSASGIQSRGCSKTFDCPDVQTAPPITDQYCEPLNGPTLQAPPSSSDEILDQDSIIKSAVKLLCPVDTQRASQGSGTIIDPSGTILTNKHVIAGTLGCLVGFINDFNDEPYFGERQIADVLKVSPNDDVAILKIRNPQNRTLTSVDIKKGNSNIRLGTKVIIYGYPAKFGTKITYTSGDFSGTDGNYLKTTAILEYGNSGGGAFLKDGTFIGVPSAVVKGELNALGYILSINTINAWLGNTSITSGGTNNNYSRVSVLEDIDLKKLDSLKLFIPDTDLKGNLVSPVADQNSKNIGGQSQSSETQGKSTIVESTKSNQKISSQQSPVPLEKEQKQKVSWAKRFFSWITKLFK